MALWRIRIRLSDDRHSRAQLDLALADQQVKEMTIAPRDADSTEMAGDLILDLQRDENLSAVLSALHRISPQVFVSRADGGEPTTKGPALITPFRRPGGLARRTVTSRVAD